MTIQVLNNGDTLGTQRGKLNSNFSELDTNKTDKTSVLTKTNTTAFTPTGDYHPVTKLYADNLIVNWHSVYNPQNLTSDVYARANHTGTIDPIVIDQDLNNRFVTDAQIASWNAKEDGIGVKGTAFNKNFGTIAGSVAEGNHSHTKADVGLEFADNTADIDKGISTLQQAALDLKANQATTYTETEVDTLLDGKRDDDDYTSAQAVVGDGINNLSIDTEGRVTLNGNARISKTIEVSANGVEFHPTQSPVWVNFRGSRVISFVNNVDQTIFFNVKIPHDYEPGTDIEFHIHGLFESATTGNRKYEFTYSWANVGDVFPTETTTTKLFTDSRTADIHLIGSIADLPGAGKTENGVILCSFTRLGSDAQDTEPGATLLMFSDFHYTANKYGEPK